jgi:hypothetical protein
VDAGTNSPRQLSKLKKNEMQSEVLCLQNLVGYKSCNYKKTPPYFIEDIEGFDMEKAADYASDLQISGEQYLQDLISTSARLMLADVQTLVSTGSALVDALGELCSACNFVSTFQAAGGVKVTNTVSSKFAVLNISRIEVLCSSNVAQVIVLDDGETKKYIPFTPQGSSVIIPLIDIDYSTTKKSVKIYLQDATVATGQVVCEVTRGCGCGGSAAPVQSPVMFTGLVSGADTTLQYGFKVCASVSCSSELLTCTLAVQAPNIFGVALLFRVAMHHFGSAPFSSSINRTTMRSGEEINITQAQYYESKYNERLKGSPSVKGIKEVTSKYLGAIKDNCIVCNSLKSIAYVTG